MGEEGMGLSVGGLVGYLLGRVVHFWRLVFLGLWTGLFGLGWRSLSRFFGTYYL